MNRAIVAAVAALGLAACQHRHPLSDEALRGFERGQGAILVVDGDMTAFGCGSARYNFIRLDDGSKVSVKSEAGAGTEFVPPGRFAFTTVTCAVWGTGGWHIPASGWFSVVDVKPGEVVYLGTLVVLPFAKTASGAMLQSQEMQIDWGQVPTYTIKDELDAAKRVLRPEIGDLVDRMIARPPTILISEQEFAAMIQRGYQPDAAGVAPTREQAKARVSAELYRVRTAPTSTGGS